MRAPEERKVASQIRQRQVVIGREDSRRVCPRCSFTSIKAVYSD